MRTAWAAATIGLAALLGGCDSVSLFTSPGNDPSPDATVTGREGTVVVVFRNNLAAEAVDVQFYMTTAAVSVLPDELFVPANLLRPDVGIAGTGLVLPQGGDALEIPCASGLMFGTAGGLVLDEETGEQLGVGEPRWADADALGLCGGIIFFNFSNTPDGYGTTVAIDH
ncbi:MAG: hypothetical protein AABZ12_06540 [Planctomycetota bacterium]